jgi:hypothetical protein
VKQNRSVKNVIVFLTLLVHLLISSTFLTCQLPAQAVVPTTNSTSTATGDGVTNTFTFTFELLQASDMTVYVNSVLQTYNVAYIVTPTGGSYPCTGGTITFQTTYTPANGAAILMARSLTLTQTISLPVEGALPSSTLQTVFDRACMQIQQIQTNQLLSLQLPITSIGVNTALPTPVALNLIGWDSGGINVVNYTPQQIVANVTSIGLGNVVGPASSTIGHIALFNNGTGTLLSDLAPGASGNIATSNGSAWVSSAPAAVIYNNTRAYLVSNSPYADGSSSGNTTIYAGPTTIGKNQTWDNGSGVLTNSVLTQVSLSLGSLTSASSYSLFEYNNSGTWTLEADVWSGINTPLTYGSDAAGRLTKSGSTNKLLIAEFYLSGTGTVYNWTGERDLVNIYNKIPVAVSAQVPTASWSYTSSAWRGSDANTTNGQGRISFFESSIPSAISVQFSQALSLAATNAGVYNAIGLNSSTSPTSSIAAAQSSSGTYLLTNSTNYSGTPSTGYNYLQAMEYAITNGSNTIYGNGTPGMNMTGIMME